MSKDTKKENLPAVAVKITAKTKFQANSVEAVAVKDIKKREKKIIATGQSLVSLWIAQGKEILEFIAITDVSQRLAGELLGVKRTALNTYCTIASDPRMLNEDFQEQLENFSQKDLIKLTKIDDEEIFDEALETGVIPKSDVIDVEVDEDGEAEPVVDESWKDDITKIIKRAKSVAGVEKSLTKYFNKLRAEAVVEEVPEPEAPTQDDSALIAEAIELTGESDVAEQALAIGIKTKVLEKAIENGTASDKILAKITDYVNS